MKRPDLAARQGNDNDIVRSAVVLLKALPVHVPISPWLATPTRKEGILCLNASNAIVAIDDDGALERTAIAATEYRRSLFPFEDVEDTHDVRERPNR